MSADAVELLDALTWDELAAVDDDEWKRMNREDRSLVVLARLLQRRNDEVSVEEQIRMVDELMTIASENPKVFGYQDGRGWLPLFSAVENQLPLDCIKILVEVNPRSILVKYRNELALESVIRAARTVETREFLLKHAISNLHSSLEDGWEDIHSFFAHHCNMEGVVKRLVEEFPGFVSKQSYFRAYEHRGRGSRGTLALHYAIEQHASADVLGILVSAYPEALAIKNGYGQVPLHVAICWGHVAPNVMQLLMTSKAVRVCNKDGKLPLHVYLELENLPNLDVVLSMVELFPSSVRKTTKSGDTPIHIACSGGQTRNPNLVVIRFLVDRYPGALEIKNNLGYTPLGYALLYVGVPMLPVIRLLVEARPKSVQELDASGNTVMHRYLLVQAFINDTRQPDLSIIEYLIMAYPDSLVIKDKVKKLTPLHIACERRYVDVVHFMAPKCKEALESEQGTDTPFHLVCKNVKMWSRFREGHTRTLSIIRALAISEKAVTAKDRFGQTPLHILSRLGTSQEFLQVILEKSHSAPCIKDSDGRIPLHSAVEGFRGTQACGAQERVVRYLLEAFPLGVHVVDNNGMTPLMLACERDVCLDTIYDLIKVDPLSNQRRREWSQVPRLSPKKTLPRSNLRTSLLLVAANIVMIHTVLQYPSFERLAALCLVSLMIISGLWITTAAKVRKVQPPPDVGGFV